MGNFILPWNWIIFGQVRLSYTKDGKAGETVNVLIDGEKRSISLDSNGLLTISKVVFPDEKPLRIVFSR